MGLIYIWKGASTYIIPPGNPISKVQVEELGKWLLIGDLQSYPRGDAGRRQESQKANAQKVGTWPLCQISRTSEGLRDLAS